MTTDARALIAEARGIAGPFDASQWNRWLERHMHAVLAGYSAALDSLESAHRHTDALERDKREACKTEEGLRVELAKLRTELGEAKLVIEQQDRDLERLRCRIAAAPLNK